MANQGHWTNGDQATVNLMNSMLVQEGLDAGKDGSFGDTGRMFIATDTYDVYRESGAAWVKIMDTDPAADVAGLRTLGSGAQQAAPGDHSHT